MHHHPRHDARPGFHHHSGLMGVFGGMINLTTAFLQGGATIVRTIVEGSVWHGCHPEHHHFHHGCCSGCYAQGHHSYHVECLPHSYPCHCSCCC